VRGELGGGGERASSCCVVAAPKEGCMTSGSASKNPTNATRFLASDRPTTARLDAKPITLLLPSSRNFKLYILLKST
jgi:hypothetical protein